MDVGTELADGQPVEGRLGRVWSIVEQLCRELTVGHLRGEQSDIRIVAKDDIKAFDGSIPVANAADLALIDAGRQLGIAGVVIHRVGGLQHPAFRVRARKHKLRSTKKYKRV